MTAGAYPRPAPNETVTFGGDGADGRAALLRGGHGSQRTGDRERVRDRWKRQPTFRDASLPEACPGAPGIGPDRSDGEPPESWTGDWPPTSPAS